MNYWIIVESYHNRNEDAIHKFQYLGVDLDKFKKKKFSNEDILITYVTKLMKFSDIRKVVNDNLINLPNTFNYSFKLIKCIQTQILKNLDEIEWINAKPILNKLETFMDKKTNLQLLNAPIKVNTNDYNIIKKSFNIN
ncbi:MAG: hypothetical protein ISQ83_07205 [Alphaproteobacteria bacterium]|nr:hypothetical protein [Alphaproteobacteria bacterium]